MKALLVIDMQIGSFEETARYDTSGVVERINRSTEAVRENGGVVIFVQHYDAEGGTFAKEAPGWRLLPEIETHEGDLVIAKTACDAFYKTELLSVLRRHEVTDLFISGCATDFCVDTTVRAALSHDFNVIVVCDAHTTADREHLDARSIIEHHNQTWKDLISPSRSVQLATTEAVPGLFQACSA